MKTIHKFTHQLTDIMQLHIPVGGRFLKVGRDTRNTDELAFWFEVDTEQSETTRRSFFLTGTGHPVPKGAKTYLDSVMMTPFIWHIYEGVY